VVRHPALAATASRVSRASVKEAGCRLRPRADPVRATPSAAVAAAADFRA
jgi:hypothetical protein